MQQNLIQNPRFPKGPGILNRLLQHPAGISDGNIVADNAVPGIPAGDEDFFRALRHRQVDYQLFTVNKDRSGIRKAVPLQPSAAKGNRNRSAGQGVVSVRPDSVPRKKSLQTNSGN